MERLNSVLNSLSSSSSGATLSAPHKPPTVKHSVSLVMLSAQFPVPPYLTYLITTVYTILCSVSLIFVLVVV